MNDVIHTFNSIFVNLLDCKVGDDNKIQYNTDFDVKTVNSQILAKVKSRCSCPPPNVVILEPDGAPTQNEEIFSADIKYKKDLSIDEKDFLNICALEDSFQQLI